MGEGCLAKMQCLTHENELIIKQNSNIIIRENNLSTPLPATTTVALSVAANSRDHGGHQISQKKRNGKTIRMQSIQRIPSIRSNDDCFHCKYNLICNASTLFIYTS